MIVGLAVLAWGNADPVQARSLTITFQKLHLYCPLKWWLLHKDQFPILWMLAQIYLAIPAISAPSERAFSIAGFLCSARRCRLKPEMVEDLHFLHENAWILREGNDLYTDLSA